MTPREVSLPTAPSYYCRFAETTCTYANLPHWDQRGVTTFVTFRMADSLPQEKIRPLETERIDFLSSHSQPWGIDVEREYFERFDTRIQKWLDAGFGACSLKDDACRQIVENALRFFDGKRYVLHAFVVMPNHVHVLLTPVVSVSLSQILHSWKSFTAKEINKVIHAEGQFWQKESWDRLVRGEEHLRRLITYIVNNNPEIAWSAYA